MKMVKSLLLGSAAGVVAIAGAQAADLPVKAKAVEYVKICSLYGAGFYYIPGTDICMKVGGLIRFQMDWANGGGSMSNGGGWQGTGGRNDRTDSADWTMRTRGAATFDTRQQTQYGVLRTYLLLGFQQDSTVAPSTAPAVYITRGFLQIAGFTFGKAVSYYDFVPSASMSYFAGAWATPDTGDAGQMLAAYTAQFGGGVSASIAVENSLRAPTVNTAVGAYALGAAPTSSNLGAAGTTSITGNPDIVGNIRWDGAWGAVQLAAVLHDVSASYYGAQATGFVQSGHPGNKWGYAVSPGLRLNAPMIGPGDYFIAAYSYSVGDYQRGIRSNQNNQLQWNGQALGFGFSEDGVYGVSPGSVELTTAWSVTGAYEHFWTPALQTSLYASYGKTQHNDTAKALICGNASWTVFNNAVAATPAGGCNPDWSYWNIGSRTQWNVTKSLYVGVDVLYSKLKTATVNSAGLITAPLSGSQNAGVATLGGVQQTADQSAWAFAFRVHRDIVP